MKGIFKDINTLIFETPNLLELEEDHKKYIQDFFEHPKTEQAAALFDFITRVHQKDPLYDLLLDLRDYEKSTKQILSGMGEHFCHSASVYTLGLAIYNNSEVLRRALNINRHGQDDFHNQKSSFLFRWSLAACLHDLAYPLELSLNAFHNYAEKMRGFNNINLININSELCMGLNLLPLLSPNLPFNIERKDTALGLISNQLTTDRLNSRISYETLYKYLNEYITNTLKDGRVDHGIISSWF